MSVHQTGGPQWSTHASKGEPSSPIGEDDGEENQNAGAANGDRSSRRIACDICRGRKVRCDRVHPVCGRCRKLGHKCGYTMHRKPDAAMLNIFQALATLHERLAQTEAQLAMTQQAIPHTSPPNHERIALEPQQAESQLPPLALITSPADNTFRYDSFPFINPQPALVSPALDSWAQPSLDFDSMMLSADNLDFPMDLVDRPASDFSLVASSANTIFGGGDAELPPKDLHVLHQAYFSHVHAAIPMVNWRRFSAQVKAAGPQRPELKSLSYSIALLGVVATTPTTPTTHQVEVEETCYHFARKYLNMAEGDDEASGFNSISMLQACILVAYYEFRRTSFARAWMSLGRAIRLGKMLGLHRVDPKEWSRSKLQFVLPLPEAGCPEELEERRRALWVLFTFDAYASVRTGSSMAIEEDEISIPLPSPGDPATDGVTPNMPPLSQATTIEDRTQLSSFSGIILMVVLYRRYHRHVLASSNQDATGDLNYSFWQHHYQIDKDVRFHATDLLGHLQPAQRPVDPLAFCVHANLCAIQISLHDHAISKVHKNDLPDMLRVESENRCLHAVIKVAGYASLIAQLDSFEVTVLKRISSTFLMWPLSTASQFLLRQLKNPTQNGLELATLLQQLLSVMVQLTDGTNQWDSVMEATARELARLGIMVGSDPVLQNVSWVQSTSNEVMTGELRSRAQSILN